MKACSKYKKLLLAELHGLLDDRQLEHLQEHLRECPACRKEKQALYHLKQGIYDLGFPGEYEFKDIKETVTTVRKRLNRKIAPRTASFSKFIPRRLLIPIAVSSAILILAFGLVYQTNIQSSPKQLQLVDQKNNFPAKDIKVIENLELLEDMELIHKLVTITSEPVSSESNQNNHSKRNLRKRDVFKPYA